MARREVSVGLIVILSIISVIICRNVIDGVIVPAYFDPPNYWSTMENSTPQLKVAVANVDNGPGTTSDPSYVSAIDGLQKAGAEVYGYVPTQRGDRAIASCKRDIDTWISYYAVTGIFFDEAPSHCLSQSYYAELYQYVHDNIQNGTVILNPGTQVEECLATTADIICNFESSYSDYINNYDNSTWVMNYPSSKFYHIVYNVPSASDISNLGSLTIQRNAAFIYYTTDNLPNPYDSLPSSTFWNDELDLVSV